MTKQFHDANFEQEVLHSDQPVLVDFWAPWCGPCRAVSPVIDELAEDNLGQASVGKVNVDEAPETARRYGITSIPTVALFHKGEIVKQTIGVHPKAVYQELISSSTSCSSGACNV